MDNGADFLVKADDDPAIYLVVNVKAGNAERSFREAESGLKRYMAEMRVPTGVLVTPRKITVFRDSFSDVPERSITSVGEIPTGRIPELRPFSERSQVDPLAFEDAVRDWLFRFKFQEERGLSSDDEDPKLIEHLGPAITMGDVLRAAPRRLSAAG